MIDRLHLGDFRSFRHALEHGLLHFLDEDRYFVVTGEIREIKIRWMIIDESKRKSQNYQIEKFQFLPVFEHDVDGCLRRELLHAVVLHTYGQVVLLDAFVVQGVVHEDVTPGHVALGTVRQVERV